MYISHVSNHLAIMIVVSKATEADLSRATQQPHIRHYFNDQHIFNISSHLFSRASVLRYVFIFCSNFLRPALLLSCGVVAVVVVRFDQGDIDFYSLRALHYHFAQVQFAVRVSDLGTVMLTLPPLLLLYVALSSSCSMTTTTTSTSSLPSLLLLLMMLR